MASRSALPKVLGAAVAGGAGYYFYKAGGSAQGAKERAEADAHKASADIKNHLPYRQETDAQGIGARTGAKFDEAVAEGRRQYDRAESDLKGYAHDAKARINELDAKVEDEANKAKKTASGWFGSK